MLPMPIPIPIMIPTIMLALMMTMMGMVMLMMVMVMVLMPIVLKVSCSVRDAIAENGDVDNLGLVAETVNHSLEKWFELFEEDIEIFLVYLCQKQLPLLSPFKQLS